MEELSRRVREAGRWVRGCCCGEEEEDEKEKGSREEEHDEEEEEVKMEELRRSSWLCDNEVGDQTDVKFKGTLEESYRTFAGNEVINKSTVKQ